MGFMDKLGGLISLLQKPAGAYAGLMGGAYKALGGDQLDPEGQLGYDDPLEGLIKGWNKPEGMYRTMNKLYGDYKEPGTAESLFGGISDIGSDPLILTGPLSGPLKGIPAVGKIAEGAGTIGKMGEGASALGKAGQLGRRYMLGLQLTGEPFTAAGVAGIQGLAERGIQTAAKSKALANVLSKGKGVAPAVEDVLEEGVDAAGDVVSKTPTTAAAQVDDALEATAKPGKASVRAQVLADMDELAGKALPPTADAEAAGVAKLKGLLKEKVAPEPAVLAPEGNRAINPNTGTIPETDVRPTKRPPPVVKAPPRRPGLGEPSMANQDLYESMLGPNLAESDMPGFLRQGGASPQKEALQKIVESRVSSDFDAWRQAAQGPFSPTRASEQLTPEELAFFLQNYG